MHRSWWSRSYGAAVILFLSSGAVHAECDIAATGTGSVSSRLEALATCVSEQANEISNLKSQLANSVPAAGNHNNTKAIVAYFSDKGEKTCPEGWRPYEPAKNRFIVGASTDKYPEIGKVGGEEAVTLTELQMPKHNHSVEFVMEESNLSGNFYPVMSDDARHSTNHGGSVKTSTAGSNNSHNNMPPYIALYFCKKD